MQHNWTKIEAPQIPAWNGKNEDGSFTLEPNDELVSQFMEVKTDIGPNKANLYVFKKEDGEEIVVWGSTILDTRFKNLVKGEWVRIVYLGLVANKVKGRAAYRNYEVYHDMEASKVLEEEGIPVIDEEIDTEEIPL